MTDPRHTRVQELRERVVKAQGTSTTFERMAEKYLSILTDAIALAAQMEASRRRDVEELRDERLLTASLQAVLREFARLDDESVLLAKEGYGGELVSALHDARSALSLSAAPPPPDGENP